LFTLCLPGLFYTVFTGICLPGFVHQDLFTRIYLPGFIYQDLFTRIYLPGFIYQELFTWIEMLQIDGVVGLFVGVVAGVDDADFQTAILNS
jgi:hypothetical protein